MARPVIDLTDKTFGRWVVISEAGRAPHNGETTWNCVCRHCGVQRVLDSSDLRRRKHTGCLHYKKKGL